MLEILKTLFDGAVLTSMMYVGSKCWKYLFTSVDSPKDTFKFLGWLTIFIIGLNILSTL